MSEEAATSTTTTERRRTRERVPPHNLEAERALLGALLLQPSRFADAAHLSPADFYSPQHALTFTAVAQMAAQGDHIDVLTVHAKIADESVLSLPDLMTMESGAPTLNAKRYADIVAEHAQARRMLTVAGEVTEAVYAFEFATAQELLADAPVRVGVATGRPALEWEPIGAALRGEEPEVVPDLLYRSDEKALVYPGRLHWIQAEPGGAKSWVALICVMEQLGFGEHVGYLDYESNRADVGKRLRKLGLEPDMGEELLHYARPGAHTPGVLAQLASDLGRWRPGLVVLDGAAKSLQRNGYSEDKADEVGVWVDRVIRPVTSQGVAVIVIDHVTKNPETRGRYARGSGVKLAEVDGAAYSMKRIRALSHSQAGEYHLIVEKDKEGQVAPEGDVAAVLRMEEDRTTHVISFSLDAPTDEDRQPKYARAVRERVLSYLRERPHDDHSLSEIRGVVVGKAATIVQTLAQLVDEGEVDVRRVGSSKMHRLHVGEPQGEF